MSDLLAPPQPGIHRGVTFATYRQWDAFGASDLKAMRQGPPAMVPWKRSHPDEISDAMKLGTAAHCAILEPHRYLTSYAHKPDGMSFATKEGKAWKAEVPEGVVILTHDQWGQVADILDAFLSKPAAADALKSAEAIEASLRWNDPDTGLPLKARPDWFTEDGYVVDLKISRWASANVAFRAYVDGWMHQLAHYYAGLLECGAAMKGARLVIVHPQPPQSFRVYCVELKRDALGMLHLENERTIKEMAACAASGVWPGAPEEWTAIDLPAAALTQMAAITWDEEHEIGERHG